MHIGLACRGAVPVGRDGRGCGDARWYLLREGMGESDVTTTFGALTVGGRRGWGEAGAGDRRLVNDAPDHGAGNRAGLVREAGVRVVRATPTG